MPYSSQQQKKHLLLKSLQYALSKKHSKYLKLLVWLMLGLGLVIILSLAYQAGTIDKLSRLSWEEILYKLRNPSSNTYIYLLFFFLLLPLHYYLYRLHKYSKLVLTEQGIKYDSGLPDWLNFVSPSWWAGWAEVEVIKIKSNGIFHVPGHITLLIDTRLHKRHIRLFQWVDPDDPSFERFNPLAAFVAKPASGEHQIKLHPLYQFLQSLSMAPEIPERLSSGKSGFDLVSNRRTLTVIVVLSVGALYALVDTLIGPEGYIDGGFWEWYIAIGVMVYAICVIWLLKGEVPKVESHIMSMVLAAGVVLILYPAVLRINQLSDDKGLQSYSYVKKSFDVYKAKDSVDLPLLKLSEFVDYYEYWDKFELGSEYNFKLRKGGLGFYQYHRESISNAMRAFYLSQQDK